MTEIPLPAEVEEIAEWMARALPTDEREACGTTPDGIRVSVRRLARKGGMARTVTGETRVIPSGGVEIGVRLPPCRHDPTPVYKSGRLGPGWTEADLKRRIRYLVTNARALRDLRIKRDGLYNLMLVVGMENEALDIAMLEEEAVSGHPSDLGDMSLEDIRFWWTWINAWRGMRANIFDLFG